MQTWFPRCANAHASAALQWLAKLLLVSIAIAAPALADALVLQSSQARLPAGHMIVAGSRIVLPPRTRLVLLDGNGDIRTLVGPITHTEPASPPPAGVFEALQAMLVVQRQPNRLGGVRGDGADACRQRAANWTELANLWRSNCQRAAIAQFESRLAELNIDEQQ